MHTQNLVTFYQLVLRILSDNENLSSIKGHYSAIHFREMTGNKSNIDLVNITAHTKFGQILSIISQDIERKQNLTSIKGHKSVINLRKMTGNNSNLDLVNITALTKFGQIISISSQYIERKRNSEGNSDICQGQYLRYECGKNDVLQSQSRSCQYQSIYNIWLNSFSKILSGKQIMTEGMMDR